MSIIRAFSLVHLRRCNVLLFAHWRSSFSTSFERNGWKSLFNSLVGFTNLKDIDNRVDFTKGSYLSNKDDKDQCWQLLLNSQHCLEDVHCKLDPLPVHDENYTKLISKEISLIKMIRSLSFDCNLHDKVTQDSLKSFTVLAGDSLKVQMSCEKKVLIIYMMMTAAGSTVGLLIGFTLFHFVLKNNARFNDDFEDSSEIISWIIMQNDKLKGYLQDLKRIIVTHQNYSKGKEFLDGPNYNGSSENGADVEILNQNEMMLKEMLAVEFGISTLKEFKKLPELVALKNLTSINENEGLWILTTIYGAAAVILPFVMFIL